MVVHTFSIFFSSEHATSSPTQESATLRLKKNCSRALQKRAGQQETHHHHYRNRVLSRVELADEHDYLVQNH